MSTLCTLTANFGCQLLILLVEGQDQSQCRVCVQYVAWKVVLEQSFLVYFGYFLPGSLYLISIKSFTHIGTHDRTMHCSTLSEILSHSVHCVCVNKHTHACTHWYKAWHSQWDHQQMARLLQVYNRNKHCRTRVSCLMKWHQTSPPTVCLTGRNYSAFCSKFLLPSSCMCLDAYILNCIDTN